MEVLYRANDSGQMKDLAGQTARLAESYGWTAVVESENPSWPSEIAQCYFGFGGKNLPAANRERGSGGIHPCWVGMRVFCGKKSKTRYSFHGPTITDAHSVREALDLNTLEAPMDLFLELLASLR